jgi:hypothetical protein
MQFKILLIIILIANNCFGQNQRIDGKWFVEDKTAESDLHIPTKIIFSKDSAIFDSKSPVESMFCTEYFMFNSDSTFDCVGECHAYDSTKNWFNYYGSYGVWELKNKRTILLDYYAGISIFHSKFKIQHDHGKMVFIRTEFEIETFEEPVINEE